MVFFPATISMLAKLPAQKKKKKPSLGEKKGGYVCIILIVH